MYTSDLKCEVKGLHVAVIVFKVLCLTSNWLPEAADVITNNNDASQGAK